MIENILNSLNEFEDYDELVSFITKKMTELKNKFNFKDFINSLKELNSDEEVVKQLNEQIQLFQNYGYPVSLISQLQAIVGLKKKEEIIKALEDLISKLEGYGYPPTCGYPSCYGYPPIAKASETVNLTDIEIFKVGDYGTKGKYTMEDLETILKNFYDLKDKLRVPVKLGHESFGFEMPAVGWVSDLRIDKDKGVLLADFSYVPKTIAELIKNKAYRNVSAEIYLDEIEGKKPPILRGVAILGVSQPEVKGLEELRVLYNNEEKRISIINSENLNETKIKTNDEVEKLKMELLNLKTEKFIEEHNEKILPKDRELVKTILINLDKEDKFVKFQEKDLKLSDLFKLFIINLPKLIYYEEIVKQKDISEDEKMISDIENISKQKNISFIEAWKEYIKEKEIFK